MSHDSDGDLSLVQPDGSSKESRPSLESTSSASTTSLVFERINDRVALESMPSQHRRASRGSRGPHRYASRDHPSNLDDDDDDDVRYKDESTDNDLETGPFLGGDPNDEDHEGIPDENKKVKYMDRSLRRILIIASVVFAGIWVIGLAVYILTGPSNAASTSGTETESSTAHTSGGRKKVTLDQVLGGQWSPKYHSISWIAGADGEDGLLLERGVAGKDYLVVEDIRAQGSKVASREGDAADVHSSRTLMRGSSFVHAGISYMPDTAIPSRDLRKVLLATGRKSNWRHSSTAAYWIFDVDTQTAEPLVPGEPGARLQLAEWSPIGDSVSFTRDNNIFLRRIGSNDLKQVTQDGGPDVFNGVPDWVYEEEVIGGESATWWSQDGNYFAFLRTNETGVPDYPVQYFVSRPSGEKPAPGKEDYPEVRQIKYPKAGAHNPVVELKFFDVRKGDVFDVKISAGFPDDDRLITTVLWAGGKVIIKETNRVSDIMHVVLVDVVARSGKTVRSVDVGAIDGGWFEISQNTRFIPADSANGRPSDGYVDTVIHDDGDHLAYFTPLDSPDPVMLTSGNWEVVDAPSAIDLERNLVYFIATKESSIQRHVYSVKLTGQDLTPLTNVSAEGYYDVSFSDGAGYALLSYQGPQVPWQKVVSTLSNQNRYEHVVEKNTELAESVRKHGLPIKTYGTINVDGVDINYVERRPPNFNKKKKYPVLFQQYSGPGSQSVKKKFEVDFQSYVASSLGYIVVTVDGRGTGFMGRKARVVVRGDLGRWEAQDQIAAGQHWAGLDYVDASRLAIWGWSYGGFTTLKTLEQDGGQTFRYGMAVAPVTDWRYYDSIYTERYMLTPQANAEGYDGSAINNVSALSQNVRFLLAHGVADDNVHMQNSLVLLDKLDLAGVENYDVHVFPDSDHGIFFHNANRIVYDSEFLPARLCGVSLSRHPFRRYYDVSALDV